MDKLLTDKEKLKKLSGVVLIIGVFIGIWMLKNYNPETIKVYPVCIFHKITGLYCPGCGSTRATYWLIHGDVMKAIDYNGFYVISLPFIAAYIINRLAKFYLNKTMFKPIVVSNKIIIALLFIIIIYTILRNIPYYPFTILAP